MAKQEKKEESAEERAERIATGDRAERNAMAGNASPHAGRELDDSSDEQKAKRERVDKAKKEAEKDAR